MFIPMFAEAASTLPTGRSWRYEPKYDGVRCVAVVTPSSVQLLSRGGENYARQFPEVVEALVSLRAAVGSDLVLDGELVACASDGYAGYEELSCRLAVQSDFRIRTVLRARKPAALVTFDLLVVGSEPLITRPLVDRRAALERTLTPHLADNLRLGEHSADGEAMLARAHAGGWEGLVAKRSDSTYVPGKRGPSWVKWKPTQRQEFVICGFTESERREHFRALILGYYADGKLVYAGDVGSGFTRKTLALVRNVLDPLVRNECPFDTAPDLDRPARWVLPTELAEIRFDCWTTDGRLRFPRFLGLRQDKPALTVVRES